MSNHGKNLITAAALAFTFFFILGVGPLFSQEIAEQLIQDFQLNEDSDEIAGIIKAIDLKSEENLDELYGILFSVFDIVHNNYGYDKTLLLVLQELEISIPPGEVTAFQPIADEYVSALAEPCILPDGVNEGTNTKGFFND